MKHYNKLVLLYLFLTNANYFNTIYAKNYKSMHVAELDGFLKLKNDFDSFKIKEKYNAEPKTFEINGIIDFETLKLSQILSKSSNYT